MLTYTKTIEVTRPRLTIEYDTDTESPREWGNIGHFFTSEKRYKSPDGTDHPLYQIMMKTADEATDSMDHIKLIRERAHEAFMESNPKGKNSHDEDLHIIDIYPVHRFEHTNIVYSRGLAQGFDYSNCGFYFVTAESISGETFTTEDIEKRIDQELETYTKYVNGDIYRFTLYDENGELVDQCGGFYDIEDIRERLPGEWKSEDLSQYLS